MYVVAWSLDDVILHAFIFALEADDMLNIFYYIQLFFLPLLLSDIKADARISFIVVVHDNSWHVNRVILPLDHLYLTVVFDDSSTHNMHF